MTEDNKEKLDRVVYMAVGFISTRGNLPLWIFRPLCGIYYAMTEGKGRKQVAEKI